MKTNSICRVFRAITCKHPHYDSSLSQTMDMVEVANFAKIRQFCRSSNNTNIRFCDEPVLERVCVDFARCPEKFDHNNRICTFQNGFSTVVRDEKMAKIRCTFHLRTIKRTQTHNYRFEIRREELLICNSSAENKQPIK